MKTSLTPLQQHVAKHYEGGEFAVLIDGLGQP